MNFSIAMENCAYTLPVVSIVWNYITIFFECEMREILKPAHEIMLRNKKKTLLNFDEEERKYLITYNIMIIFFFKNSKYIKILYSKFQNTRCSRAFVYVIGTICRLKRNPIIWP